MRIEIDITYRCNLKCRNCNRQCYQYPSETDMTLEQIDRFVEQSKEEDIVWERLSIMGGEPFLHPHLDKIVEKVKPVCERFRLLTNGTVPRRTCLDLRPQDVCQDTGKKDPFPNFVCVNVAPRDLSPCDDPPQYTWGCCVSEALGFGLTPYGYYPCPVAGPIDRVFNFDIGKKRLRDILSKDERKAMFGELCPLCGHVSEVSYGFAMSNRQQYTVSWRTALRVADERKMTRF